MSFTIEAPARAHGTHPQDRGKAAIDLDLDLDLDLYGIEPRSH